MRRARVLLIASPLASAVVCALEARADVAVEWQGSAAATIGVTTNVANTPIPADDAPDGTPTPEWDGFAAFTPGIQFSFETPRTQQTLSYVFDYRLYFVHSEANAISNGIGYSFNGIVSDTTNFSLGLALSQTQASAFNVVGSQPATPSLTTSSDAYLFTGSVSQGLSTQTSANDVFSEGLSFTVNDNLPIDAEGGATNHSLTYLGSGTLRLNHEFRRDTLGGEIGSDIGVFPETFTAAAETPRHTDVVHRASLDWHHDWSERWSHTLAAGAIVVYETGGLAPVVNPAGSASLDYASERGSAGLSYAHAAQPNVVLQQMTLADTITLHGLMPLGSTGLDLSGAAAFLSSRSLGAEGFGAVTYNASVDAALGYIKDGLPLRFELRYQLNEQFGLGSDADTIPEVRRQNLQLTITAYFPHAPQLGAGPTLVPLPTPTSNPSALGRTPATRGQLEDKDRQDAEDRKEKKSEGDGGGKSP